MKKVSAVFCLILTGLTASAGDTLFYYGPVMPVEERSDYYIPATLRSPSF